MVFVALIVSCACAADYPPVAVPADGQWRDMAGEILTPEARAKIKPIPINGVNTRKFKLTGIAPGAYRVGFVVGTGMQPDNPNGWLANYRVTVEGGAGEAAAKTVPVALAPPPDAGMKPQRKPDEVSKEWAAWRGFAMATQPLWLDPNTTLALSLSEQIDIIPACWLKKVDKPQDTVAISLRTDAIDNAFTLANPPKFAITAVNAAKAPFGGKVRIDCFDLLTEKTTTDFVDCHIEGTGKTEITYQPKLPYGVFRLTVRPTVGQDATQSGFGASNLVVANGPAKLARDLPEDWPLGTHHSNPSPILKAPMAGFKWYRYFHGWAELNPKPGEYHWKELDATIEDVRKVGGKLLLCMEGAPAWTSKKEGRRVGAVAPKDWNDLRTFAQEFVKRYGNNDVLQAIEPWNEPNANLRWHDTPEALVELTRIWFEATRKTKLKVVGISVSPGHHIDCVEGLTEAGILKCCDIVAGHFYEEPYSPNRYNLRNNMALHIDLLRIPQWRENRLMPIWDTETGVGTENANGGPRPGGRMQNQNEMVEALKRRKDYNGTEPWLMWAGNSERRMAATWASSTIALLGHGVSRRFSFHPNWYSFDHALNLPWVANATLGSVLDQVDYHYFMPLAVNAIEGPGDIGVVAWRLGKPGQKQVVVMWAERMTVSNPHPGGWTRWIEPVKAQLPCKADIEVQVQDLYLRGSTNVRAGKYAGGEAVTIPVGEEPVFVWGWKYRDQ
jgi:hypothetical protein